MNSRWQARDLAFLLDETREWQRVKYRATNAVVFAKKTLRCAQCGWTGSVTATDLQACPKCSSKLKEVEILGNQEAAFPLDADARFVETRTGSWDHDHCLICDVAIGRDARGNVAVMLGATTKTKRSPESDDLSLQGTFVAGAKRINLA